MGVALIAPAVVAKLKGVLLASKLVPLFMASSHRGTLAPKVRVQTGPASGSGVVCADGSYAYSAARCPQVASTTAGSPHILPRYVPLPAQSIAAPNGPTLDITKGGNWNFAKYIPTPTQPKTRGGILDLSSLVVGPPSSKTWTSASCPSGSVPITKNGVQSCLNMSTGMDVPSGDIPPPSGQGVVCGDGSIASNASQCPGAGGTGTSWGAGVPTQYFLYGAVALAAVGVYYAVKKD